MHPGHLLLVALVLAGVAAGGLALIWAWRTSYPQMSKSVLAEFVRRDRQDPEAARRWLRDQLEAPNVRPEPGSDNADS